jgi:hypothetical protein
MPDTPTRTDEECARRAAAAHDGCDFLDQASASDFLRRACGVVIAPKTLQKRRVTGGGPPFCKALGRVLYERDALKAWGEAQRSQLVHSTSELQQRLHDPADKRAKP